MASDPILDPASLDFSRIIVDREEIQRRNAQRYEFALLDGILHADDEAMVYAGFHDIREDAWWTRGHIPGRPLFPGVLQIEVAAQMASYASCRLHKVTFKEAFIGFLAVDGVKFRQSVAPPARYLTVIRIQKFTPRRTIVDAQGFVDNQLVFEGQVTGMKI